MHSIDVSIIIPTLNRARYVSSVLRSLVRQSEVPYEFEVLLVDNGSTDGTRDAFEQVAAENPSMRWRYLFEPVPGALSGKHRGVFEAGGEILVFLNDDVELGEGWLEAIGDPFADPSTQIVGGPCAPAYETEPPEWLHAFWIEDEFGVWCDWLSLVDCGNRRRTVDATLIWTLNMAIRRKALEELGGFHPDYLPKPFLHFQGDAEAGMTRLANARGYTAVYEPGARVTHQLGSHRLTPEYITDRGFRKGIEASYAASRSRLRGEAPAPRLRAGRIASHLKRVRAMVGKRGLPRATRRVLIEAEQSILAGYRFHQAALRSYDGLAEWVARDDYWDYRLPALGKQGERGGA